MSNYTDMYAGPIPLPKGAIWTIPAGTDPKLPLSPTNPAAGSAASSGKTAAVVPGTAFASMARGIYVGATGDVSLIDASGATTIFYAAPTGSILPVYCTQVTVTNTTATRMVALM